MYGYLWQRVGRPAALALVLIAAMTMAVIAISVIGIRIAGDVTAWQPWLHRHAWCFAIWRFALYALIARGWWWMRTRVRQRDGSLQAQRRLLRAEVSAVLAIALTEMVTQLYPV